LCEGFFYALSFSKYYNIIISQICKGHSLANTGIWILYVVLPGSQITIHLKPQSNTTYKHVHKLRKSPH